MRNAVIYLVGLGIIGGLTGPVSAHPYPDSGYHRVIEVRLLPDKVHVLYRLEVDAALVFLDVQALADPADLPRISKKKDFYDLFTRCYAPIIADNLVVTLDRRPLPCRCVRHEHRDKDDGHIVCDFTFEAAWQPAPGETHLFSFKEGNFELKTGRIDLSLATDDSIALIEKAEPDKALKNRSFVDLKPGDEGRLRQATATFSVLGGPATAAVIPPPTAEPESKGRGHSHSLFELLDSQHGFLMMLVMAAFFGAAHAWTPGHGKTVAAAYLVGENGTIPHALLLGLATTLSHTSAVILLACLFQWLKPYLSLDQALAILGVGGGLLIAGLGFWLLMRRLAGQADHFHLTPSHHAEPGARTGWWGVVVLGLAGGIVPCTDAIFLFLFAIFSGQVALAVPLLLAFSAGLAAMLTLIGIGFVYTRHLAARQWGESRWFKALPLVSAILVTGMGLWLCWSSLNPPA